MDNENNFYKDIIDNLYDGVYFVDRDRVITYWNKGAERITGYSAEQTIGRSCRDNLLNHVTANGVQLCLNGCPLAAVMQDGQEREVEVFLHHADGHRLPVSIRAAALRDAEGNIVGAIESFSTSTGLTNTRRELRDMYRAATTDALTGIANRRRLEGKLSAVIAEYQRNSSPAGLLFMDLDHFKQVNDTYGHKVGDNILRMVCTTMKYALRGTDTVGRWGGEEFLAILYNVTSDHALRISAERVRALVERSQLDLEAESLSITISIGATLLLAGDTPESFVERADQLMYQSKQAGRNRVTIG